MQHHPCCLPSSVHTVQWSDVMVSARAVLLRRRILRSMTREERNQYYANSAIEEASVHPSRSAGRGVDGVDSCSHFLVPDMLAVRTVPAVESVDLFTHGNGTPAPVACLYRVFIQ